MSEALTDTGKFKLFIHSFRGLKLLKTWWILLHLVLNTKINLYSSAVVRTFAHGAMGRGIDPSWGGPIELFLVPASPPRLV